MPDNPTPILSSVSDANQPVATLSVLIVDDDEALRYSMAILLQRHGFAVDTVSDGQAALNHMEDHRVTLLITDIFMPGRDGLELIVAVRKKKPRPILIAMSGGIAGHRAGILDMANRLGAEFELLKPFDETTLLALVHKASCKTDLAVAPAL